MSVNMLAVMLTLIFSTSCYSGEFAWPMSLPVAVSLAYDDGYPDNLDIAIPQLEQYGMRGSFYLQPGYVSSGPSSDIALWKVAHLKGHEIGSHGYNHICSAVNQYNTPGSVFSEVLSANNWLNVNIGVDTSRTFAYPCGETVVQDEYGTLSEEPYLDAVATFHPYARIGTVILFNSLANEYANMPAEMNSDRLRIKALGIIGGVNDNIDDIKTYLEDATQDGKWVVLIFHSVSSGVLPVSAEFHQELLSYLYHSERYWVAPVRDVANYVVRSI